MLEKLLFKRITPGIFRLLLALLVMVYHSVDFLTTGHYAVYVFFMLSGYWIFKMYNEKYRKFKNSYIVYLCSRIARLMPIYWLLLLFSILAYFAIQAITGINLFPNSWGVTAGLHNIFILGISNTGYPAIGTTWSLDVEIQFYVIAPLLLLTCRNRRGIPVLIVASLASVLLVYYNIYHELKLVLYLPYFIIGGLLYLSGFTATKKWAVFCLFALAGILLVNYSVPELRTGYLLNRDAFVLGFNYREGLNVILALLTVPFISLNVRQEVTREQAKKDQTWSSMSYVIYLLHWPLLQLYAVSVEGAGLMRKSISLLLFYITCLVLSYLISKYVDAYFEKKRRYWIEGFSRKEALNISKA